MLVASHPLSRLPPAVHDAFRRAVRILNSVTSRAPDTVLYLTVGSLVRMAHSHAKLEVDRVVNGHTITRKGGAADNEDKSSFISGITSHSAASAASIREQDEGTENDNAIVCKCMLMQLTRA